MGVGVGGGTGMGTGTGAGTGESERFARLMRALKERAGLSYGVLARKLHTSTSTLHRYCNGEAVPTEFAVVDRFARACGASQGEAVELHRAWLLADARRRAGAGAASAASAAGVPRAVPVEAEASGGAAAPPPEPEPAGGAEAAGAGAGTDVGRGRGENQSQGEGRGQGESNGKGTDAGTGTDAVTGTDVGTGTVVDGGRSRGERQSRGQGNGGGTGTGTDVDEGQGENQGQGTGEGGGGVSVGAEVRLADVVDLAAPQPGGRLPWYRRRAVAVAAAGMTAGVVTVAVLAAVGPGRPGTPTGTVAGPSASAAARPGDTPAPSGGAGSAPGSGAPSAPPSDPAPGAEPTRGTASASASAAGQPPGASAPPAAGPVQGTAVPVRAAVRSHVWAAGCDHAYLTERGPGTVPPPPVEADAPAWASAQRAVHAGQQILEVTVHGAGAGTVVLEGLDVRVAARRTPPAWNVYQMSPGCGGALTPAVYAVNLDAPRPVARPVDGGDSEGPIRAPAFPMRVSAADPVVLRVEAATTGCDCDWYLDLRYTGPTGSGRLRIDDNGRPLRTSAATGRPVYGYASEQGRWAR